MAPVLKGHALSIPSFETVRVVHPLIPDSEHDVPVDSLFIMQHSGWVRADSVVPAPVTEVVEDPAKKDELPLPSSSRKQTSATKKEE